MLAEPQGAEEIVPIGGLPPDAGLIPSTMGWSGLDPFRAPHRHAEWQTSCAG